MDNQKFIYGSDKKTNNQTPKEIDELLVPPGKAYTRPSDYWLTAQV